MSIHDKCAIFGVFGDEEAANLTYLVLYALQHRGQESTGIISTDGEQFHAHKARGLVADNFDKQILSTLKGDMAIGHNRYSTTGASSVSNIQPFAAHLNSGDISIAHNGNLINSESIRHKLVEDGAIFHTSSDTENFLQLLARRREFTLNERLSSVFHQVMGAYSLVIMTKNSLIGAVDPYGIRPLSLGKKGDSYILSSESCAFDLIEAEFVRDILPGEIITIDKNGPKSFFFCKPVMNHCIFEYVYFSRPDSLLWGKSVYKVREKMGMILAEELETEADIVIPVPDSGIPAALGFAKQSGIRFEIGLMRNHYVGRTFIEPSQSIRHFGVKIKLNPIRSVVEGKNVVVIDDSIVRGTTSKKIIKMIKEAGAKKVHMRISSPPFISPCFYGIDTPTRRELIASSHTTEEIRRHITADSLNFLSLNGMIRATGKKNFCTACFTGNYPIKLKNSPEYGTPLPFI